MFEGGPGHRGLLQAKGKMRINENDDGGRIKKGRIINEEDM